ncbi:MAG: hypothetical protein UW79_C0003G0002 [Candidatus Yanofskybacteria bacterium GW2011_GWA2_44_9]|nr:MAG: hypothetical protein UW79_C0003G0002 [Candidatus Yanofskybacteria bacterium GW2011_GWA2_44_9]
MEHDDSIIKKNKETDPDFEQDQILADDTDLNRISEELKPQNSFKLLSISIVVASVIVGSSIILAGRFRPSDGMLSAKAIAKIEQAVTPEKGVVLPVVWGDLGKRLVESGVIDQTKFEQLYAGRGGIDDSTKDLLTGSNNGKLLITKGNANLLLNLLWALGLGTKNEILEKGEMSDPRYGGAGKFASTGGWTLSRGAPMQHYSAHALIPLTPEQQKLVDEVSRNIYRPCCGNSTHFPDCNHGMAMLGLLELMASQGVSENDMYKAALAVNSYWFPDTYLNIARYLESKDIPWSKSDPKGILGANFSSSAGYQAVLKQIQPATGSGGGGGCGV